MIDVRVYKILNVIDDLCKLPEHLEIHTCLGKRCPCAIRVCYGYKILNQIIKKYEPFFIVKDTRLIEIKNVGLIC